MGVRTLREATLYVSISQLTCHHFPGNATGEFRLVLPSKFATVFQKLFQQINQLENGNIFRAHLPYIQYHEDQHNHSIDTRLKKIYAIIHEFGDPDTKRFVEQLPYFS